jgi:hypothetical protein
MSLFFFFFKVNFYYFLGKVEKRKEKIKKKGKKESNGIIIIIIKSSVIRLTQKVDLYRGTLLNSRAKHSEFACIHHVEMTNKIQNHRKRGSIFLLLHVAFSSYKIQFNIIKNYV